LPPFRSVRPQLADRFAIQVEALGDNADRALVLADLVSRRSDDGRFTGGDITEAFYGLNIPPPGTVGPILAALRKRGDILQHKDGRWATTPSGDRRIEALAVNTSEAVEAAAEGAPGAEFAHTEYTIIPPWAAPPRWSAGIARLLDISPFERNVFCMTRFPSEGELVDPVKEAIGAAREVLSSHGLTLHLASDAIVEDDLLGNVGAYMWACCYGLGIIEDRLGTGLNYNAVIEVGGMIVTGRRCGILKDETVPALPTDLSGQIYRSVDLSDLTTVQDAVEGWATNDLRA
jgi:hypothetical protein